MRCERHWQRLRDYLSGHRASLQDKLQQVYTDHQFISSTDPEQQLYDGFLPKDDVALFPKIRESSPEQLAQYASQFKDPRLKILLFRYRARHYPETLTEGEYQQWQQWCYQRLTDYSEGASIILDDYFERLSSMPSTELAQALYDYGDDLLAHTSG